MGGYFHGRRRKLGLVTLALACMFACGWVRSFTVTDDLDFLASGLQSRKGGIETTITMRKYHANGAKTGVTLISWHLSYAPIVIPLILIAAWLLLSRSRSEIRNVVPEASK